jgi:hypothetical protein
MGDMEDVEMEVKAGDLYVSPWQRFMKWDLCKDLDVIIKSPRGNWLYHMT